jgi:prophage regulatory protein
LRSTATSGRTEMNQKAGDSNAIGNVVRLPAVCRMTGLGRSTIYRMEAIGRFPQRIKLGLRAVGWMESEVQAWLTMRAKALGRGQVLGGGR